MSLVTSSGSSSLKDVLSNTAFTRFLAGRFTGSLAVQMQTVAVGLQVYELTRNPLDLGLVGLSQFIPFLIFVLPAGQLADRWNRKRILLGCYVVQCLCALALLLVTVSGVSAVWPTFLVMACFGTARACFMPASQALTPNLVPRTLFRNAIAVNSATWQIATISGPAIGGAVYALAGPAAVYGVAAILLLVGILSLFGMRAPPQIAAVGEASWRSLMEGAKFVWRRPILLGATSLDLFAVLFGGATALLPAYATDILQVGPQGLGWLRAAPGVGAGLMAAVLALRPIGRHVGATLFSAIAMFGCATVAFAISRSVWASLGALVLLGAADMISVFVRQLLVQLDTPDDMRGRVGAINSMFIGASNELGEFESGLTAAWWGVVPSVIIGGLATIAIAGIWSRVFPALRRMDRFPAPTGANLPR
jgi:MFS family permease